MENITKNDLQEKIQKMQNVYNAAATPENIKATLKNALTVANKRLDELIDAEQKVVEAEKAQKAAELAVSIAKAKAAVEKKETPAPAEKKAIDKKIVSPAIAKAKAAIEKTKAAKAKVIPAKKAAVKAAETLKSLVKTKPALQEMYAGTSESELIRDAARKAMKPGKRKSASGNTYYEKRGNRADLNRKQPYLESGGTTDDSKEVFEYYIEFLNKEKNFKKDKVEFSDWDAAKTWGKENLDNFNIDMIHSYENGGNVKSRYAGDKVYFGKLRNRYVVISADPGDSQNMLWANEYFKTLEEAKDWAKEMEFVVVSKTVVKYDKKTMGETIGGQQIFTPPADIKLESGGNVNSVVDIRTSNGTITADAKTGKVISVEVDDDGDENIALIDRFDLDEYKAYHKTDTIPKSIDILDLGYWNKDETYEEPAFDWREMMAEGDFEKGGKVYKIMVFFSVPDSDVIKLKNIKNLYSKNRFSWIENIKSIKSNDGGNWYSANFDYNSKKIGPFSDEQIEDEVSVIIEKSKIDEDEISVIVGQNNWNKFESTLKKGGAVPVYTAGEFNVYKRTFEAKKYPAGSEQRKKLNENNITSEYMPSYKFAIKGNNFSSSKPTKQEAIDFADKLSEKSFEKGGTAKQNKNNIIKALAVKFSQILWSPDWVGPEDMPKVIAENAANGYNSGTCETHNYVDANMAMDAAFTEILGRDYVFNDEDDPETEKQNEIDTGYINAAWQLAKENDFDIDKINNAVPGSYKSGGEVDEDTDKRELLIDENRGVYIPKHFYENFDFAKFNLKKEDYADLSSPDNEFYWDAWDELLAEAKTDDGATLEQDGDLWLVKDNEEEINGEDEFKKGGKLTGYELTPYENDDRYHKTRGIFTKPPAITLVYDSGFTHNTGTKEKWYTISVNGADWTGSKVEFNDHHKTYYITLYDISYKISNKLKLMYNSVAELKKDVSQALVGASYSGFGMTDGILSLRIPADKNYEKGGQLTYKDGTPVRFSVKPSRKDGKYIIHNDETGAPASSNFIFRETHRHNNFNSPEDANKALKTLLINLHKNSPEKNPAPSFYKAPGIFNRIGAMFFKDGGSLSGLKKKLQLGQAIKMVNFFGQTDPAAPGRGQKVLGLTRYVVKVQTNGVYFSPNKTDKTGSYWEFPPASLVDITDKGFTVFGPAARELNDTEKKVIANEPRDDQQQYIDAISDGSTMYYRRKRYYEYEHPDYAYLFNPGWQNKLRYDSNKKQVYDKAVKGEIELAYEFVDDPSFEPGGNLSDDLMNFNIDNLDPYERRVYDDLIKKHSGKSSKSDVLQILINQVEGDYSQLSGKLAEVAKNQDHSTFNAGGNLPVDNRVLNAYIQAALWSTTDSDTDESFDKNYGPSDIAPATMAAMEADVRKFFLENEDAIIKSGLDNDQVAGDIWLTRNRHGAGFWDRDIDQAIADKLSAAAYAMGEIALEVGDDGKVHYFPEPKSAAFAGGGQIKTKADFYNASIAYLKSDYGLDPGDMDMSAEGHLASDRAYKDGVTPQEFIDAYAEKYDMQSIKPSRYGFADGGQVNRGIFRDRKFRSQEPHEQSYQRKTSPKNPRYKEDGGNIETEGLEVPGIFTIDDEKTYPGYHAPNSDWNGWATPVFEKDVALKILDDTQMPYEWRGDKLFADINVNNGEPAEELEEIGPFEITLTNGQKRQVYDVGAFSWIWSKVEGKEDGGLMASGGKLSAKAKDIIKKSDKALVVVCKSEGNPDFRQYSPISDPKFYAVNTLKEAADKCRAYIDEWDLGGGNWAAGQVYDADGKFIARVSYNGRVWDGDYSVKDPNEITGEALTKNYYAAGGKVIGKTKSGKQIYTSSYHHKEWQKHRDAYIANTLKGMPEKDVEKHNKVHKDSMLEHSILRLAAKKIENKNRADKDGNKFDGGGKLPQRTFNSPVIAYTNFEDGSHINLIQLKKPYKNGDSYAVHTAKLEDGSEPNTGRLFKTLEKAQAHYDLMSKVRSKKIPVRNSGVIDSNKFDGGGTAKDGKNGYVAFYKNKQMDVWADSSYQAQQKAAAAFKAKKSYDVSVVLAELDGKQVVHTPDFAKGGQLKYKDGSPVIDFEIHGEGDVWQMYDPKRGHALPNLSVDYWIGKPNLFKSKKEATDALKTMLRKMHVENPGYNPEFEDGGNIQEDITP